MCPTVGTVTITREQAVAFRLHANNLIRRLPHRDVVDAAFAGLQDSAPRDALLALHARVEDCVADDWARPEFRQTYSPRAAVYVLPARDFGVFTVGRMPLDDEAVAVIEQQADEVCRALGGEERRAGSLPGLRSACASGRIALRWTTSALWVREVPRPRVDIWQARLELVRRHVRRFAPTTPGAFAWWAGLAPRDARTVWAALETELVEIDVEGVRAWVHHDDLEQLTASAPPDGVRLLVAPDLRLLGRDRTGLFVGPGLRPLTPAADTFHPGGVLVDGRVVGAWGRRAGDVDVVLSNPVPDAAQAALEREVAAMPFAQPRLTIR